MTKGIGEEGTKEGTSLIAGDDVCFEQADTRLRKIIESELIDEGGQGKSATNEGTVVANHHGSRASDRSREVDPPVVDTFGRWAILDQREPAHVGGDSVEADVSGTVMEVDIGLLSLDIYCDEVETLIGILEG